MKYFEKGAQLLLPLLMGALAFFMVVGPNVLSPQNIAWLASGDPATHYLGWVFFRQSPWSFPLGLNPSYGLELSNTIIFSDSNPLLAFVFKPLAAWLPEPFQYFGLWLLACFVLQAWFAWRLLGLISSSVVVRILACGLFLFAPPMILRIGGHLSLVGHFLILAALYLALHPDLQRRRMAWGALLFVTALVHAYLLAMVALIWLADLFGKAYQRRLSWRRMLVEFLCLFLLVTLSCWQAGYFSVGGGTVSGGFGLYRMNLLSVIDSSGWSRLLKDIPDAPGDYEGFNFLGLGVIFLAACGVPAMIRGGTSFVSALRKYTFLLAALIGLTLFALSNHIVIGSLEIEYPLPHALVSLSSTFRASGRMFWPVFYILIFVSVFFVIRGYRARTAVCLLLVALVIQVLDTSPGWKGVRDSRMVAPSHEWPTPMVDPFWHSAAVHYQNVRWMMPQNSPALWQPLASYAASHHLSTDAVYLGRMGSTPLKQAMARAEQSLETGVYEQNSLYIMDEATARRAELAVDHEASMLANIDGFIVLAPGWKQCAECPAVASGSRSWDQLASVRPGTRLQFNENSPALSYLGAGWSSAEAWGIWSQEREAEIFLPVSTPVHSVALDAMAFVMGPITHQDVVVLINDVQVMTSRLSQLSDNHIDIVLPAALQAVVAERGELRIRLLLPDAVSPESVGMGGNPRKMGLGLKVLTLH